MVLKFYNTLTRKKQVFKPVAEGKASLYTCGPTVYNFAHIGNFRTYVFEDLLRRWLKYKGYAVKQVMNLTDVDDKTIRDSQKEKTSLKDFTERYSKAFFEDIKTLKIEPAEVYPKATEHINEMVSMIKILLEKGVAYKTEDGIYFSISKFKNYGQLANINVAELQAGASGRVKSDEYEKENVSDFALWKMWDEKDGDVFWETELGKGRPGWHIECSAMSAKHLTNAFSDSKFEPQKFTTIDIHTGGVDNLFPHHQDETAQTEGCTGKKFVNYWMHSEHLMVNGQKMSKSFGNFYTLRDLLVKGYGASPIRYSLLSTHYRQQLNFTFEGLDAAKNALQRIWDFVQKLDECKGTEDNNKVDKQIEQLKKKFEKAMDNDLEISEALGSLFVFIKHTNVLLRSNKVSLNDAKKIKDTLFELDAVLGVIKKEEEQVPEEIMALVKQRDSARAIKNFARSDEIRDELQKKGYILEDSVQGTRIKKIN